ncbi:MAG: sugar ABC transporter substrate-binding protein [Chloroflexi bacterium]|nr:sugar ABC transporter substrate-binding protein [Chloroflexota bacterium]
MTRQLSRRDFIRVAALLSGAGVGGLLAACAPAPTPVPPTQAPAPAAPPPTPPPKIEPTPAAKPAAATGAQPTGEFVFTAHNKIETYDKWTDEFFATKYPTLKVRYDVTPGLSEYITKLQAQIAAGDAIDFMLNHESRAQSLGFRGMLRPLDDFRTAKPFYVPESELFTTPLPLLSWQGKVYAWPNTFASYGLYYNKTLFDKGKVSYPTDSWTWEDLGEAAQKLTSDTNGDGKPDVWGWVYWTDPGWMPGWYPTLRAYGTDHFDKDQTRSLINEPGGVACFQFMQDMWCKRKAVPPPAVLGQLGGDYAMFKQGIGAMSLIYSGAHADVMKASKDKFEWGIAHVPQGPAGRFMRVGGSSWSIPKTVRLPEVAWDLLRHLVSDVPTVASMAAAGHAVAHFPSYDKHTAPTGEIGQYVGESWKKVFAEGARKYGAAVNYSRIGVEYSPVVGAEMAFLADCSRTPKQVADTIAGKANTLLAEAK